ncbi:MAG: calcium-binding protein [Syntrophobacteraceae bacterium CG23_combo_of_CG06-09_8_20_14_all_50_8]|nr:MAG: calcium-binding protein [Syntrophobacteraceae bacterium CG23_combo_of_CG06-09_8_20_14_all_50_8]
MTAKEFLRHIPLFQHLTIEDRERLAMSIRTQFLKKGEVLFRKGSEGNTLYIIRNGKIKISLASHLSDEVVLAIFSEGDFFGEMALLDGMPRSADATAIEQTELLLLKRLDFISFLNSNRDALQAILQSLSQRLRRTDDLLEDTCFLNVSARFAKKLVELAAAHGHQDGELVHIDLSLTQKDLASMVRATRESINKELRILREKGLVSIQENSIYIHDLERLKRRAR